MSDDELRTTRELDGRLSALRLVVIALALGASTLTLVAVFSASRMSGPPLPDMLVVYVFLGVGVLAVPVNLVAGPILARTAADQQIAGTPPTRPDQFQRFAGETITRAALAGGPAVVLIVGYLMTHNLLVLVPLPVLLALLYPITPTAEKFARWQERQSHS